MATNSPATLADAISRKMSSTATMNALIKNLSGLESEQLEKLAKLTTEQLGELIEEVAA